MERRKLTQSDKKEIGLKCCNCGSTSDLQYHHIIPISLGGNDINSNLCCLCYKCHQLIHFGKSKNINHSKATKQGIQASDKKSGRPFGSLDKLTNELREDIKLFINDRSIKQVDLMNKHNISRNTLKKYIEIVKKVS